jgi:hypothetical protein
LTRSIEIGKEGATLSSELSAPWVAEAEELLLRLRDVIVATITTDGDEIREIHIVAASTRSPKQIVRDVETTLKAFLRRSIDHRKISVAIQEPLPAPPAPAPKPAASPPPAPAPKPRRPVDAEPTDRLDLRDLGPSPLRPEPAARAAGRVRFVTANLFVSGLRTQAQVELSWQGTTRLGSATGASARDNAHRLVAGATLQALVPYLGDDVTLAPHEVEFVRLGRHEVAIVTVKLLAQRSEKTLVGACTVEQDVAQSVVYATLAAVNRVLGGLRAKEGVEYELRPTST